jgi:hypothetical protein
MFLILCVDKKNPKKSDLMRDISLENFSLTDNGPAYIYSSMEEAKERISEDKIDYPDFYNYHIIPL